MVYRHERHHKRLVQLMALAIGWVAVTPAGAVTKTTSFTVSATVVAACTVPLALVSGPSAGTACAPASAAVSSIPLPQPIVKLERDAATGVVTRMIEF